jgi:membrane protease YdiL (CAAX protease family)
LHDQADSQEEGPDDLLFVWACGFELAIGVVGLAVASFAGFDARAYLGQLTDLTWQSVAIDVGIGTLASIPMLIAVMLLMKIPHESISAIKRLSDAPTMKAVLSLSRVELLTLSVCAGIGEELAFRGCLLPWITSFRDATGQWVNTFDVGDSFRSADPSMLIVALLVSSILFGLLHPITKLYVFAASLMGLYFGVVMIATDSLLVPIIAHAVYDAAQFLIAKREFEQEQASPASA